jgi:hypothetical protein
VLNEDDRGGHLPVQAIEKIPNIGKFGYGSNGIPDFENPFETNFSILHNPLDFEGPVPTLNFRRCGDAIEPEAGRQLDTDRVVA